MSAFGPHRVPRDHRVVCGPLERPTHSLGLCPTPALGSLTLAVGMDHLTQPVGDRRKGSCWGPAWLPVGGRRSAFTAGIVVKRLGHGSGIGCFC